MPLLKSVWNGIVDFNATDPTVLAFSSQQHFDKVLKGGYAYIGDKTQLQIKMSEECDLALVTEEFLPMRYALGLPNNSPYTKLFSDM